MMSGISLTKALKKYEGMPLQVKASLWFLICMVLQKGMSVLTTPIFTRLLGSANYGQFGLYSSWENIISVFITLRLTANFYTQGLVQFEHDREEFSSAVLGFSTTFMGSYFVVYWLFRDFFNNLFSLSTMQMTAMFIILWTEMVFTYWLCEQRVDYKYQMLVGISLLVAVVKPIVGIIAVLTHEDQVTARIVSIALVNLIFYTPFLIPKLRSGQSLFKGWLWKYALVYSLPLVPHYLSQIVLSRADTIMIGEMIGSNEAGIYTLSYSLGTLLLIINNALMQTMTPWMYRKIREKQIDDIKGVAYISLIAISILNLLLVIFAPEIIAVFAPPTFRDAIWVIPPIAISGVMVFSYDLFATYEFYHVRTFFITVGSIIGACLNIVLNYLLIPHFGFIAAGYTTLICYICYALGHYFLMKRVCREKHPGQVPYEGRKLLIMYSVLMVTTFIIMLTYEHFALRMICLAVFAVLLIIFHKRIIAGLKRLANLKKTS